MTEKTDDTAYVEVFARMLCAADAHVYGDDHPTWQQLSAEPGGRVQDDYRKAARWLVPRMTVVTEARKAADRAAVLREAADGFDRHAEQILDGSDDKAAFVAKALREQAAVWREAAETLRRMAAEAAVSGRSDDETGERCPDCQMPHDLTPGSLPVAACQNIRRRIAEAERHHAEGNHNLCRRVDCDVIRQRYADRPAVGGAQQQEAGA